MPWEHAYYCGLGMDAIVIVCSRNTNIVMVWAWMLWLSFALGTRALPWFGHGCAIVCSRNTNVIMVWTWSHYFWYAFGTRTFLWFGRGCAIVSMLSEPHRHHLPHAVYALGTRTLFWFGNGCTCYRMLSEHERYSGLGMDALVIVCSRNTNVIMVWTWSHYFWYAFGTRTFLWFGRGCAIVSMLSEPHRHHLPYAVYALGTRTLFWFGNGCTCYRMLSEHERYYGLGMVALFLVCFRKTNAIVVWAWMRLSSYALGTRTLSWFGHGCTSNCMLAEHECSYGLGMDALVIVCSRNRNVIMVWAWSHYFWYAFGTRTLFWFGHGCTIYRRLCYRMLSEHEHYYGLGMDAR